MLKFPRIFYQRDNSQQAFEGRIRPEDTQRSYLVTCINKIEKHLRPRIAEATQTVLGMDHRVAPRFRSQGSWSYNTCVIPAQMPPQEMDWDHGIYLPVEVWEENGPPHLMAKAYFTLVEKLLSDLCLQEGWELILGKDTCIRIQVANWAHIDVPLYAAPESELAKVQETRLVALAAEAYNSYVAKSYDFAESDESRQQWEDIDRIFMAMRTGEWKPSDPEIVAKWFKDRIAEQGDNGLQLRRLCRYLKAWRDHHWINGGPTSVSLMIAVVQNFEPQLSRDDRALAQTARAMSFAYLNDIREPGIDDGKEDFNRLNSHERKLVSDRLASLASLIDQALSLPSHKKDSVIGLIRQQFGDRIPSDTSLVEPETNAEHIRQTPAKTVPVPIIHSSKSG